MKITYNVKNGSQTMANVLIDILALLNGTFTTGAAILESSVVKDGTYVPPRRGINGGVLFIEMENAAVIGISPGTNGLLVREFLAFDWTTLTGTAGSTCTDNTSVNGQGWTDSRGLGIGSANTYTWNFHPKHLYIGGWNYGTTTHNATTSGVSPTFYVVGLVPPDANRFDGINTCKTVIYSSCNPITMKRYAINAGITFNNHSQVNYHGGYNGVITGVDGVPRVCVGMLELFAPGGDRCSLDGSILPVGGSPGVGQRWLTADKPYDVVLPYITAMTGYDVSVRNAFWGYNALMAEVH